MWERFWDFLYWLRWCRRQGHDRSAEWIVTYRQLEGVEFYRRRCRRCNRLLGRGVRNQRTGDEIEYDQLP